MILQAQQHRCLRQNSHHLWVLHIRGELKSMFAWTWSGTYATCYCTNPTRAWA